MYMTMLSVADARANFSKLVESAATTHERFEVTKNGTRVAVVLGADDYDSLIETLDILGDAELMAKIHEGERDLAEGRAYSEQQIREAL